MEIFDSKIESLFSELGTHKNMVLSTSYEDKVTSRMMSIIIFKGNFYFQTDITFRKYQQINNNHNVALCVDNFSLEGICTEIGKPTDHPDFINLYKKHYNWSYNKYSKLDNERLFKISPQYVQRWIYENDTPYVESFDFVNRVYNKEIYKC